MSKGRRLIFVALTWLGVLLLAEGGARAVYTARGKTPPVASESLENEWIWASRHLRAGQALLASNLEHDPALGWRLRPNQRDPDVRTNSAGMRGEEEFDPEPRPGEKRLLLVGDSYTYGHGVRDEETFAHRLARGARALPEGWKVLNLGVPGFGTDQCLLMFEERGRRYRPKIVILGFFVRDWSRNTLAFRDYAKPMFRPEGADPGLALAGTPVIAPEALFEEYASGRRRIGAGIGSYLWGALGRSLRSLADRRIDERSPRAAVLGRIMARFRAKVKESGAEPVWMIIPSRDQMLDDEGDRSRWAAVERIAAARAKEIGLRSLSVTEALRRADRPERPVYKDQRAGGHLSAAGNEVVAWEIERFLRAEGLLE